MSQSASSFMPDDELLRSIGTFARTELGLPVDDLRMETRLEGFDIDSLDVIKLTLLLEKRWCVKLAAAELAQAETVGEIVKLIQLRRS